MAMMIDDNTTVLFQGDSITDAERSRVDLHNIGRGYAHMASSLFLAEYPEKGVTFLNRGISGNTVKDLRARWQKDTLDLKPDVLSILIGVNGRFKFSAEEYKSTYSGLLDSTLAALPNITLVLCDPFVNAREKPGSRARVEVDKRRAIVKKLALKYKVIHVPTQDMYDEAAKRGNPNYWIWDGVHPMPAGHELLARRWINTVAEQLTD